MGSDAIAVEVAYARPDRQWLLPLVVPAGTTVRAALQESPLGADCPELDLGACPVGIWGKVVPDSTVLRAGDRVEVYRPLAADPRTARRAAVARGGTLGGSPGGSSAGSSARS